MTTKPQAHITVGKQRRPKGQTVYLSDGTEFEIELYNPHSKTVLAKIFVNDMAIGTTGLVLRPGQRVYLERFLDKDRKFKFDSYEVEGENREVQKAIANNGEVRVEFYEEQENVQLLLGNDNYWKDNLIKSSPPFSPPHNPWTTPNSGNPIIFGNTSTGDYNFKSENLNDGMGFCNFMNVSDGIVHDNSISASANLEDTLEESTTRSRGAKKNLKSKKSITGRVEQGQKSDQAFTTIEMDFNSWTMVVVKYKLLPIENKPVEAKDLRSYCTNCGLRKKKGNWKYCPQCGTQI